MSIRSNFNSKDRLREKNSSPNLVIVPSPPEAIDPLRFWTSHPSKPCLVDLSIFDNGQSFSIGTQWKGPFRGRSALIAEMAPAIHDHLMPLAKASVEQFMNSLRAWWRLFDAVEEEIPEQQAVFSTSQLTELHRQRALDQGMDRLVFGNFLLLANKTRVALGMKFLYWQRPEHRDNGRHLPPQWQTDLTRHELKHRWFAVVDRWELAFDLLESGAPLVSKMDDPVKHNEQSRLLRGYQLLENALELSLSARPGSVSDLYPDQSRDDFYKEFTLLETLKGRYPDGDDIRAAFHLCLATTGWNAAVLLTLNASEPVLEPHPKDPTRYILRGFKDRAGTEQVTEGLFKTRGGAGFIIQKLITQTAPLRSELQRELDACRSRLHEASSLKLIRRISKLEQAVRSVWLYTTRHGIFALDDDNFSKGFLSEVIASINRRSPLSMQISTITPSDLRDAHAARVYHASGGSILAVMKALNHRRLSSTRDYLNNTLLNEEHAKLYSTFSLALWDEIRIHQRVDPTILAMRSRYGEVPPDGRQRLETYRTLLRSRVGVGCKNPQNPPKHIAPDFQPDGQSLCPVQRCLLCLEHAVIFPDSLPGLCKRLAELRYLFANMSIIAYVQSSFGEEMANIELALLGFDTVTVQAEVSEWEKRIAANSHRVIEFDGTDNDI